MTGPKPPPDRSWVEFNVGLGDEPLRRGRITRFIDQHTRWFVCIIIACVGVVATGFVMLVADSSSDGPMLIYDPQVVHRTITTDDGRRVDCAVSDSGMSCDWSHPQ